ncbi:hypothetical protein Pcinc_020491 [Petrolisthes cinctipes]|uniref:limulus clotting factor C n=1 Tax=Petrolisthes cinctipes TaxID=88211 RepID=A0AAE1KJ21_PETCI|nr:hypothetical protein Pcinc_020491 [Petrolisthes cinctipes]
MQEARVVAMTDGLVGAVMECGQTFSLEGGQTVLLFSRQDLYRYECTQTFLVNDMDGKLEFTCHHLHFKFNCFIESLKVTVDGNETTYCMSDQVAVVTGKEVKLEYLRQVGGMHGGYVCTLTAHSPPLPQISCDMCGVTADMEKRLYHQGVLRIVQGTNADRNEYPWMAYLVMFQESSKYRCGGTLITDTLVLSAAHCLAGFDIKYIKSFIHSVLSHRPAQVGLGQLEVVSTNDLVGANWITTTQYEIHPQYDDYTFHNDICMIILPEPITFTPAIRPICLPQHDLPMANHNVTATGWGAVSYEGALATSLQEVDMTVWSNAKCQEAWKSRFGDTFQIAGSQVCAAAPGKDTCNGDSGGPLIVKMCERWQLLGVTSFGYKCAEPGLAGVYTRVSKYLTWINQYIPDSYCSGGK